MTAHCTLLIRSSSPLSSVLMAEPVRVARLDQCRPELDTDAADDEAAGGGAQGAEVDARQQRNLEVAEPDVERILEGLGGHLEDHTCPSTRVPTSEQRRAPGAGIRAHAIPVERSDRLHVLQR